jgi:hypothetical protein
MSLTGVGTVGVFQLPFLMSSSGDIGFKIDMLVFKIYGLNFSRYY